MIIGEKRDGVGRAQRKLLLVSNLYPPYVLGGAELIASYLAEEFASRGHQVSVITTCAPDQEGVRREVLNGVAVYRFFPQNPYWQYDRSPRPTLRTAFWHLKDLHNTYAKKIISGLLSQIRPDVLHTHNIDGFSPVAWSVGRSHAIPVVHTSHDYHLLCPRATLVNGRGDVCISPNVICKGPYRHWYRRASRNIDVFCGPSQTLIDLHKQAGMEPRRYALVHNGIPLLPSPSPKPTCTGQLKLLFLGHLSVIKGFRLVLEVMRRLPASLPIRLDVGGQGALMAEAVAQADPRIHLHGFVSGEKKAALLGSADVLLFPSLWYENAPTVLLEARASGLAILASDFGGAREVVRGGIDGQFVPKGDVGAWSRAIEHLAADRSRVLALRETATEGLEYFTTHAMADRYELVYQSEGVSLTIENGASHGKSW